MNFTLHPWQFYLVIISGWFNCQQQEVIEYLRTENAVLREKLGKKRILLDDNQRRRLAVKGKILGWKRLNELKPIFTPDTILRWHRKLVAMKWDYSDRRKKLGRPPITEDVKLLVLRIARENPTWGYDRLQGALANLGHNLSDQSVGNILKENGIEPVPQRQRKMEWNTFIKAHWNVLAAIDFTTVEIWTQGGLVTFYLLFTMEVKTRRVHFAGITTSPHEKWMKQAAKNLTNCEDGFLPGKAQLIMNRDPKFCASFKSILKQAGIESAVLPPRSPNLNSYMERFFGSLKSECLNKIIPFGENSVRNAVNEYLIHCHEERNHQGLENQIIDQQEELGHIAGKIERRERLGGLLNYYCRSAA